MSRRNPWAIPKKKEPPKNLRVAAELWTEHLEALLNPLRESYKFLEPLPASLGTGDDRYIWFDRLFGHPEMCSLALQRWAITMKTRQMAESWAPVGEDAELPAPYAIGSPAVAFHTFRIGTMAFWFRGPTGYVGASGDSMTRFANPVSRAHAVKYGVRFRTLRPDAANHMGHEALSEFCGWVNDALERSVQIEKTYAFMREMVISADSSRSLFNALSGLRGVVSMMGADTAKIDDWTMPYRGRDTFNNERADKIWPLWRSQWAAEHKPRLIAAIAASKSETRQAMDFPDVMGVMRLTEP